MKRRRPAWRWAGCLWLAVLWAEAAEPVVELPAFHVSASLAHVVVSPRYESLRREATGRVVCLVVQEVREGSVAAQAGLTKGMEIHALQGVSLRGMTDDQVQELMAQPVREKLILRVRRSGGFRLFDLVVPVVRGPAGR